MAHPSLFSSNKLLWKKYFLPFLENQDLEYIFLDSKRPDHDSILECLTKMAAIKARAEYGYELEIIGLFYQIWKILAEHSMDKTPADSGSQSAETKIQKDMVSFIYQRYGEKLSLAAIPPAGRKRGRKNLTVCRHGSLLSYIQLILPFIYELILIGAPPPINRQRLAVDKGSGV